MSGEITRSITINEIDDGKSYTLVLADGTEINTTDPAAMTSAKNMIDGAYADAEVAR